MPTAIEFNNISKQYRLGLVSTRTLSHDLSRWWQTAILHKEDPYLKIGSVNDRSKAADSEYVWALKDIDFKVEQGDVVGIIGKNGAGKSTLLKLLSRVTGPTTGTIKAKGRIGSLLEVGTGFHPEMTGRENIYMNGAILGMTKAEITRKLDEIVDFSGCERYIDTPVKRYSSGMMVRLGFAVAAHLDPEILVVDEVLAVGDAEFQKKAIGKMQDVSRGEGRTVLFVSHNMASIRKLCKTGVVLQNGSMYFQGTSEEAIEVYMRTGLDDYSGLSLLELPRGGSVNNMVKFTQVEYLDENNNTIIPHCGSFLRLRLSLVVIADEVKSCSISVGIRNSYGDPLMTFPSNLTTSEFDLSGGNHTITLDIPKLPLTGGAYRLALWFEVNNTLSNIKCADFIDNLVCMNVEDDDFFDKGKRVSSHLAGKIVLCEHKWSFN